MDLKIKTWFVAQGKHICHCATAKKRFVFPHKKEKDKEKNPAEGS